MRTRLFGVLAAFLLAVLGTALVTMYVSGAEERAYSGVVTTPILVITQPVPAGTSADVALQSAELQELPARAVAADAIADEVAVAGMVTTVDLVVGEQVLSSRFASPDDAAANKAIGVPAGDQEISFSANAERTVGGQLARGDTVGVFISISSGAETLSGSTALTVHKALITNIQEVPAAPSTETGDGTDASTEEQTGRSEALPSGDLILTVAVSAAEAERIVWGREFGTLWLSREPTDAVENDIDEITLENVLQ